MVFAYSPDDISLDMMPMSPSSSTTGSRFISIIEDLRHFTNIVIGFARQAESP
jgi:hypothetical protein